MTLLLLFGGAPAQTLVGTLTDNFNDNSRDTAKWPGTYGNVVESGGRVAITSGSGYPTLQSAEVYYLTDSAVYVEVPTQQFTPTLNTTLYVLNAAANNGYTFNAYGATGTLNLNERVNGVNSTASVAYNAINHRWRRIRHSSATNLVYWEASPDGVTWTVLRSKTPTVPLGPYSVRLQVGANATDSPTVTEFDNLNVPIPVATLTDDFNDDSVDTAKWSNTSQSEVAESGGRARVTSSNAYPRYGSAEAYYLTDSAVYVEVPTQPTSPTLGTYFVLGDSAGTNGYEFSYLGSNNTLSMYERVAGVDNETSVAYNAINHRWRRIRHSSATNLVYWEASPDGVTWTVLRSKTPTVPLGPYQVRLASGIYGADDPTVTEFDNLNASPIARLTDNFDDNSRDTAKWSLSDPGSVAENNGRAQVTSSTSYPGYASAYAYYLTDSSLHVEVVTQPTTDPDLSTFVQLSDQTGSNRLYFSTYGSTLYFKERVAGVDSTTTVAYDAVAHRWRRIRHSSATNLVYWETSPDGVSWTVQRSKVPSIPLGPYQVKLIAGFGTGTPTVTEFDNFNLAPPVAILIDDFNANVRDTAKWPNSSATTGLAQSGGRAQFTSSTSYPSYISSDGYSLTDSAVHVEMATEPNTPTLGVSLLVSDSSQSNGYFFYRTATQIALRERVAGVDDQTFVTWNLANHRWRRIRHSSATNLVYWETSPDGIIWTVLRSKTPVAPLNPLRIKLEVGFYGANDTPTVTEFDNFNLAASATSYSRATGNTASASDTNSRSYLGTRNRTDSALTTDALTRSTGLARAFADGASASDALVRVTSRVRTPTESGTLTDMVSRVFSGVRNRPDTALASDTLARTASRASTLNDSALATDSIMRQIVIVRTGADTATAFDSVIRKMVRTRAANDVAAAVDALMRSTIRTRMLADSTLITDTLARVAVVTRMLSDASFASDSLTTANTDTHNLYDSAFATDIVTRRIVANRVRSDGGTASDTLTRSLIYTRARSDTASALDAIIRTFVGVRARSDTASATDVLLRATLRARLLTDTAMATDAVTRFRPTNRSTSDVAIASDSVVRRLTLTRAGGDSAFASDILNRLPTLVRSFNDVASANDAVTRSGQSTRSLADSADAFDELMRQTIQARALTDVALGTDVLVLYSGIVGNATDVAEANDTLARLPHYRRLTGDSTSTFDSLVRQFISARGIVEEAYADDELAIFVLLVFRNILLARATDTKVFGYAHRLLLERESSVFPATSLLEIQEDAINALDLGPSRQIIVPHTVTDVEAKELVRDVTPTVYTVVAEEPKVVLGPEDGDDLILWIAHDATVKEIEGPITVRTVFA